MKVRYDVRRMKVCFLVLFVLPVTAHSQDSSASASSASVDTVLQRAESMVDAGRAAAGRALVDSVLTAAAPGTEAYAEALYARASLAATAGDAERDYLRLTVEYSLSPRAPDALLRLTQLELARGDRTQARSHLARLAEDRPPAASSARANLSVARAYEELGDQPHACGALTAAQHSVAPADIELRNQIDYAARPCPPAPAASPTPAVAAATTVVAAPSAPTTQIVAVPPPAPAPQPSAPAPQPAPTPAATNTPVPAPAQPPAPVPSQMSTPISHARSSAPSKAPGYTVQVAAYTTRAPADALAAKLTARGLPARVWGTTAPFRVRVGRYPTHAAAESAAADLKSKQITGFITDAEP